ncbi:DUF732 domain-containing protein [Mycobacterium arosiense]|uniref:DUF732 domain-containing protein n=1 Tax=Mycobacterium arosiense ATCC BAA-1401 = DSM 45069 TaxID=1265311 RepID=A0A1W9ZJ80_MYCAI|nr:DUF732 domain-containing protein [Mycobacterium arosiense]ORA16030.1 hypothetical protein BST14_10905 [Mycobacterium arosiense ATCC BAA-1401 = DSM 45069]
MRLLLALVGIAMGIAMAVPAHATPGEDEPASDENTESFLSDLHTVGISFQDPAQAVNAGKSVCGLISRGESGLQLLIDLRDSNPALTTSGAAQFATISAKAYCPRQLQAADGGKGSR